MDFKNNKLVDQKMMMLLYYLFLHFVFVVTRIPKERVLFQCSRETKYITESSVCYAVVVRHHKGGSIGGGGGWIGHPKQQQEHQEE
jgi:hypothetical protein